MNQLTLVGRMTRDAEEFGNPVIGAKFGMATEDYDYGTKQRETEFTDCVVFGKLKDVVLQYAGKGREVRVTGIKRTRKYTPTKGIHQGHEVEQVTLIVNEFELLAGMPAGQNGGQFSGAPRQPQQQDANPEGW